MSHHLTRVREHRSAPVRPVSIRTTPHHRGITLMEMLVVISILTMLVAMLLPTISSVRETARNVMCISNLRNLQTALDNYHRSHNGVTAFTDRMPIDGMDHPVAPNWTHSLVADGYIPASPGEAIGSDSHILRCPNDLPETQDGSFWGWNAGDRDRTGRWNDNRKQQWSAYYITPENEEVWTHTSYGINGANPESNVFYHGWRFHPYKRYGGVSGTNTIHTGSFVYSASNLVSLYDGFQFHITSHDALSLRHSGDSRANLAFFDGHVGSYGDEVQSTWRDDGERDKDAHPTHWYR